MARQQRRNQRNNQPATPGWAWLLAGLVAGLFVAFLVYLQGQSTQQPSLPPPPAQKEVRAAPGQKPAEETPPRPRFDFYTILPEMEIPAPEPDPEARGVPPPRPARGAETVPAPAPTPALPSADGSYVLQLGSFRNREDADRLRARITMLGFEPHIQTVNINGSDWYRVRIGPYHNSIRITELRHRLRSNGLDAMLLKLKE